MALERTPQETLECRLVEHGDGLPAIPAAVLQWLTEQPFATGVGEARTLTRPDRLQDAGKLITQPQLLEGPDDLAIEGNGARQFINVRRLVEDDHRQAFMCQEERKCRACRPHADNRNVKV